MYRNYFYLYRCALELHGLLAGKKVFEAFTQEKDKLFFRIPLDDKPDHHLICDTSPLSASIYLRDKHFKARKNTISFFEHSLPGRIVTVQAALFERAIKFSLEDSHLYFVMKGNDSNVFCSQMGETTSFKKSDMAFDELSLSFPENESQLFEFLNKLNSSHLEWKIFSGAFPFAGKELFLEAKAKTTSDSVDDFNFILRSRIESILRERIVVYYDFETGRSRLLPASFLRNDLDNDTIRDFESYFEALNYFFQLKYKNKQEISIKSRIEKYIDNELEKIASKLNNLKFRIEAGSKEEEYRRLGNILLMNIHLLQKGMKEIDAQDQITGNEVKIKLDEKLSPQKNIDRFFDKSKDEKINF